MAKAAPPRCFLHGIITPLYEGSEKPSLSDMLRLHFDADNKNKCEQMITAYCQYNIREKNYSPERLKGSFKPDMDKSEEYIYKLDKKCKIIQPE